MVLATSCSTDMIDRSFNLHCFVFGLKCDLISFNLLKVRLHDIDVTGNVKKYLMCWDTHLEDRFQQ